MKLKILITKDGELAPTLNQKTYLQKHVNKNFIGNVDERTTVEKQKFVEGAIVPYYFYQMPNVFNNFADARYSLKILADHTEFRINPRGKREMVVKSMADIYESNPKTTAFIDKVQDYFFKNGFLFPDSQHFREWDDTSTSKDDIYSPLQSLINDYNKQIKEDMSPWRK